MSCCGPDRPNVHIERAPARRKLEGARAPARRKLEGARPPAAPMQPKATPDEKFGRKKAPAQDMPEDGVIAASKEKAADRMAICQACPHARFRPFMHCAKCGCVLAWKTKLKAGTCPVGKW